MSDLALRGPDADLAGQVSKWCEPFRRLDTFIVLRTLAITLIVTQHSGLVMSVGASLVISDQGLGPETGLETDFVVLTR